MTTPFPFVSGSVLNASALNAITEVPVTAKTASYTLAATDAGSRITMSSASATTVTVNTGLFTAGQSLRIQNLNGGGVCTVTAGTATVTSAGPLAIPSWGGGQLYFTSTSAAVWFPDAGVSKVLQVINGTTSTTVSNSTTTFADTGLTATITPTLSTSKILVMAVHGTCLKTSASSNNGVNIKLFRDATQLAYNRGLGVTNTSSDLYLTTSFLVYDAPASTSALVYKTTFANESATASVSVQALSGLSSLVLMEIAA